MFCLGQKSFAVCSVVITLLVKSGLAEEGKENGFPYTNTNNTLLPNDNSTFEEAITNKDLGVTFLDNLNSSGDLWKVDFGTTTPRLPEPQEGGPTQMSPSLPTNFEDVNRTSSLNSTDETLWVDDDGLETTIVYNNGSTGSTIADSDVNDTWSTPRTSPASSTTVTYYTDYPYFTVKPDTSKEVEDRSFDFSSWPWWYYVLCVILPCLIAAFILNFGMGCSSAMRGRTVKGVFDDMGGSDDNTCKYYLWWACCLCGIFSRMAENMGGWCGFILKLLVTEPSVLFCPFSTRGTEFWSKTQKERGKRIKKSRRRKLAQLEQEIGEMAQDEGRVIVLNLTDEDIANRQMGMNDRTSRRIEAGLIHGERRSRSQRPRSAHGSSDAGQLLHTRADVEPSAPSLRAVEELGPPPSYDEAQDY